MKNIGLLCAAGAMVLLVGCSDPSVQYDYDAGAHFSKYESFAWQGAAKGPGRSTGFDNAIVDGRVQRIVEAELGAKGFKPVAGAAEPDFLVSYYPRGEASRSHQVHLGLGFGMGPLGIGIGAPVGDPQRTPVAALVLEIQDYRSGSVVWKATAEGALQGSDSPQEADADVQTAVHSMLKQFPPPSR
jgi:hypothetical protein